jgi:Domain of unknown function (DUF4389)
MDTTLSGDDRPIGSAYPASFTFDPADRVANWRPLVHWLLAIPHLAILYALQTLTEVLSIVSWFSIVFTGKVPVGIVNVQSMTMRYSLRTWSYVLFMREEYPQFAFVTATADPGEDARLRVDFTPQLEDRNRLTVAFRLILVIPHLIVLAALFIAALVVSVVGFVAVLFTGRWPAGARQFVLDVARWSLRVQSYLLLLHDEYPPFSLS